MYIDNQVKRFAITWTEIVHHTYLRTSRSKWRIKLNYACGAEMILENQPDDLIQCMVLGAFNSHKEIRSDVKDIPADVDRPDQPIDSWRDFQTFLID